MEIETDLLGSLDKFALAPSGLGDNDGVFVRVISTELGGHPPLGYDIVDRKLVANPEQAKLARLIFQQYLEAGSVRQLLDRLNEQGICHPVRGTPFTRGGLPAILASPIYIGKVRHRDMAYDGVHEAIIDQELWDAVQALTKSNLQAPRWQQRVTHRCLLIGKLYDAEGNKLVPAHTVKKGRRYSYYITDGLNRGPDPNGWRLPAKPVEAMVLAQIKLLLKNAAAVTASAKASSIDPSHVRGLIAKCKEAVDYLGAEDLFAIVRSAELRTDMIQLVVCMDAFLTSGCEPSSEPVILSQTLPLQIKRRGIEMRLVVNAPQAADANVDQDLVSTIAKAKAWFDDWLHGRINGYRDIVQRDGISASYVGDVMKLAFLSPKIVEDIVRGQQPEDMVVSQLTKSDDVPLRWDQQLIRYGWR